MLSFFPDVLHPLASILQSREVVQLRDVQMIIAGGAFLLGMFTFITGVAILVYGTLRRDVHEVTKQTAKLVQKGIADELSGLVGNASTLLTTMNEMVRTSNGIGIFLSLLGLVLMIGAGWLAFHIS